MDDAYVWSVNGMQGLNEGVYIGFFASKQEALTYLHQNVDQPAPWTLYSASFETVEGDDTKTLTVTEADIATAS